MPQVSVIVPVYNAEAYLQRCVDRILTQTFSDFELILVDDGSPDSSGMICDRYAAKDSRVRVIHKENGGVAAARNSALDIAQGQYIAFCDSDDYWDTALLETAVQAAEMHQADIVHFNYSKFDGSTFLKSSDFHTGSFAFYNDADRVSYLIQTLLSHRHGWELWDRLFRRNIIETHKIRCCTTCNNFGEDLAFICKYMLHAQKLICLPNQLYMYCVHPNSIMQKSFGIIRLNDMNEVSHDISLEFHRCIADSDTRLLFPIIHLMLVNDQIIGMGSRGEYPQLPAEIRKLHRLNWWKHNINTLYRCYPQLKKQFGTLPAQRAMLFTTYLQHGNWKLYCLECAIYHKLIKG